MDTLKSMIVGGAKEFLNEKRMPLMIAGCAIALFGVLAIILWWRGRRSKAEGFQEGGGEQKLEKVITDLPPEIAAPTTEPLYQEDNCATLKKTQDALRLTEMNPKMKEFVASAQFKTMKSDAEENFRALNCDDYLKRIARGEIPAPQTSPDNRPEPPTASAAASSA